MTITNMIVAIVLIVAIALLAGIYNTMPPAANNENSVSIPADIGKYSSIVGDLGWACSESSMVLTAKLRSLGYNASTVCGDYGDLGLPHSWVLVELGGNIIPIEATSGEILLDTGVYAANYKNLRSCGFASLEMRRCYDLKLWSPVPLPLYENWTSEFGGLCWETWYEWDGLND